VSGKPGGRNLALKSRPIVQITRSKRLESVRKSTMSAPASHDSHEVDPVEAIVPLIPIVLPLVGGALMFLLAFIAVFMA
jgi:hypothetical protein